MKTKNILLDIPNKINEEIFQELAKTKNCKIQRIISRNHKTPKNKWYDQTENEFIIILQGNAEILFKTEKSVIMKEGDYLNIPSHVKHRVEKTSDKEETMWLAIHYN